MRLLLPSRRRVAVLVVAGAVTSGGLALAQEPAPPPSASSAAPPPPTASSSAAPPAPPPPSRLTDEAPAPRTTTGLEPTPGAERAEPRPSSPGAPLPDAPRAANVDRGRFQFGSYGRIGASIDGRGGPGRDANIVAHGSRLDEGNYVELELRREDTWTEPGDPSPVSTVVVSTLAIADPLFHSSGKFDATIAVRNLYVEERGIFDKSLAVWVGSRMYRGDDAYLLDWWPLDSLNTVGGGLRYDLPTRTQIALHVGANRLDDPFQFQSSSRALPYNQIGTADVAILNRSKVIESARIEQIIPGLGEKGGIKAILYGELHELASGQRELTAGHYQDLPSDGGFVLGAQLGAFTGDHDGHLNLFFRYAQGLAAYGELAVPTALANNRTTKGAHDGSVALSGNIESGPVTLQVAGYFRSFRTASATPFNYANVDEAALVVRPRLYFNERAGVFVDAAYEVQQHAVLDGTSDGAAKGQVYRVGIVPFLSPAGRGSYKRPEIRAIWLMTFRDAGAQALYPTDDVFTRRAVEHFLGLQAEWWFNSSYR